MKKSDATHEKLKLKKRRVSLPDGRYLIYFTFEEDPADSPLPDKTHSESSKNQNV
jgi:hypothetical protein